MTLFPWGRRVWQPCIKYLTGHRLQGEGEENIVRFVLCWRVKYLNIFFVHLSSRLLLFVDEADAFLRKRNQVRLSCFHIRTQNSYIRASIVSHATIIDLICVRGKLGKGINMIIATASLLKGPFSKCSPSSRKRKVGVFKFPQFEERFREALFSWWISVDGRPNLRHTDVQLRWLETVSSTFQDWQFNRSL